MKRWGLDYDTISERNPGVVYGSITGFGQDGPYKDLPGYDTLGVGMGGLLSLLTDIKNPEPSYFTFADHLTGIFGCYSILGALYSRSTTGKGQHVETSLLQSIVSFIQLRGTGYLAGTGENERQRSNMASAFVAQDGKPFVFHLSSPPKFWEGLCEGIGHPELKDDPRFNPRDNRVKLRRAPRHLPGSVLDPAAAALDRHAPRARRPLRPPLQHRGGVRRPPGTAPWHGD